MLWTFLIENEEVDCAGKCHRGMPQGLRAGEANRAVREDTVMPMVEIARWFGFRLCYPLKRRRASRQRLLVEGRD